MIIVYDVSDTKNKNRVAATAEQNTVYLTYKGQTRLHRLGNWIDVRQRKKICLGVHII